MKKSLLACIVLLSLCFDAVAQKEYFTGAASCFIPVGKFNEFCNKPGGRVGRSECKDANGKPLGAGQFVITKHEMDMLISKECAGHRCNMRNIEYALGIICSMQQKGPWDDASLVRVDIPPAFLGDYLTWPTQQDCGANDCFQLLDHKTSGGFVEGFVKPVFTQNCVYDTDSLFVPQ